MIYQATVYSNVTKENTEGRLVYNDGDVINERYRMRDLLGTGSFAQVIEVYDQEEKKTMALKVVKNLPAYADSANTEIKILKKLAGGDSDKKNWIIHLNDHFEYKGHTCLLFDYLPYSVIDFLELNKYQPFPMSQIRHIGWQVSNALDYMHDNGLTHADVKPENIMFVNGRSVQETVDGKPSRVLVNSQIKLIDMGSCYSDEEDHPPNVTTRHYRSPEMIIGMDWSQPVDLWALGCLLYELYTGKLLFKTKEDKEHLAMIELVLGKIPTRMADRSESNLFVNGQLDWSEHSNAHALLKRKCQRLHLAMTGEDREHMEVFSVMKAMLKIDPSDRITVKDALAHAFYARLPENLRAPPTTISTPSEASTASTTSEDDE